MTAAPCRVIRFDVCTGDEGSVTTVDLAVRQPTIGDTNFALSETVHPRPTPGARWAISKATSLLAAETSAPS